MTPDNNAYASEQEELAAENARYAAAKAAIREIEDRQAAKARAADIELLANVRDELLERQQFYDSGLITWRQQAQDYANANLHIQSAREAVDDSQRQKPSIAEFLPNDPEVVRWQGRHLQLEQRLREAERELAALPNPEVLRMQVAAAMDRIVALQFSVTNLTNKLQGWGAGGSAKAWLR